MKTKPSLNERIVVTDGLRIIRAGTVVREPSHIKQARESLHYSLRDSDEELNKFVYIQEDGWSEPKMVGWASDNVMYEHEYVDVDFYGRLSSGVGKHARTLIALEIGLRGEAAPEELPVKLALTLCRHYARLGHSAGPELVLEWKRLWLEERSAFLNGEPSVWSMMYGGKNEAVS